MKKFIFLITLFTIGLTVSAQDNNLDSVKLVTYQIDTTGYTHTGLEIPEPFYITITEFALERNNGFYYTATSMTYTDTANVMTVHNKDFNYSKRYYIPASALSTFTPVQIFNNTVRLDLKNIYGANNVTKLN